jgi:acyl-CoA synthetase (NDP forming)
VDLPQPDAPARAVLEARIPEFGSPRNPCDVTAQVLNDPASLEECADALLADAHFSTLLVPQVFAYEFATRRLPVVSRLAQKHGKIVCNVWCPEWLEGPGSFENEADPHVAVFRSMDRCFGAISAWHWRGDKRAAGVREVRRHAAAGAAAEAAALLREERGRTVAERAAKAILSLYGVPVVGEALVQDAEEAAAAAMRLGFPVALKVESPAIPHKTDAGVLRLGLKDPAEVRAACTDILARASALTDDIAGVLVQPMVPAGVEVMVGARIDPLFGPLVVVGLGGIFVELLRDRAVALAPVTQGEAEAMLRGLKGAAILDGFRGSPPVDIGALADIVVRISEFAADQRAAIAELDVNPLICAGDKIIAVDGLIVKADAHV